MICLIAYDLREPRSPADYAKVIEAIKGFGPWMRVEQSVWIIESNQTHIQVRDYLSNFVRVQDALFVGHLGAAAWNSGLDEERKNWLMERKSW